MQTETWVKLILGIVGFTILEVVYWRALRRDTERQLEIGATLDPDGKNTATRVARRKDSMARGLALSYMLFVSSMFDLFRPGLSYFWGLAGTLLGFLFIILIFSLKDDIQPWESRQMTLGRVFLFTTRLVAYAFTIVFFLK